MRFPSLLRGETRPIRRWFEDDFEMMRRWLSDDFEKTIDRLFARFTPAKREEGAAEIAFTPDIDLVERANDFLVKAELPGLSAEDVEVSVVGDALQIRGQKKAEREEKEENYYLCERSYGSFLRRIPLPTPVKADKIEARMEKGVLEVTCPKSEAIAVKKVDVKGETSHETAKKTGGNGGRAK